MALANCISTLKSNKEISPWLADDIDQALANRGKLTKKKALAAYIDQALADMKGELEDIYDDLGIDAKDPLLGYEEFGGETVRYSEVRAADDATESRSLAIEKVLQEVSSVEMDGVTYSVSKNSLNKMTAEHGENGETKPYQQQRIVAIQSLRELAEKADVIYREDDGRDKGIDRVSEGRVWLNYKGDKYLVRLLGKIWKPNAKQSPKMHSMAIEDVIIEKPDAALLSPDVGSSLSGETLGVDKPGDQGVFLSDSATLEQNITPDDGDVKESTARLSDDLDQQAAYLTDRAVKAGYTDIDDWAANDIAGYIMAAEEWREENPAEVLESPYRAVDTESAEFKRWFGSSKLLDDDGNPQRFYHITNKEFTAFNPGGDNPSISGAAIWLSPHAEHQAAMHNVGVKGRFREGSRVLPVYVKMEKPLVIDDKDMLDWARDVFAKGGREFPQLMPQEWVDEVTKDGEYDGIIFKGTELGWGENSDEIIVFEPTQIKSAISNSGNFSDTNPDIRETPQRSQLTGQQIQNTWASPDLGKFDDFIRKVQDKMIDTKRVVEEIKKYKALRDDFDPYLQETLYHGRAAKQVDDFTANELRPLFEDMAKLGVEQEELDTYLWAAHAQERNAQIAKINPAMPDGGSGMTDQQAADLLAGRKVTINGQDYQLNRNKMVAYRKLAGHVKKITDSTINLLVASGLETQDTVNAWKNAYQNYVPLMRDMEADDNFMGAFNLGMGTGQGFSVRGPASKRATGSERTVVDILANVAMQRERAITRAEKNRVAMAVYGMALQNPNTDFWLTINPDAKDPAKIQEVIQELISMGVNPIDAQNIATEPKQTYVDPNTGLVTQRINPQLRTRADVLSVRINGKDRYVMFSSDPRAQQMVTGLKNLDAEKLGVAMQNVAMATRYFSSINTQYNPIFGLTNILRDSSTAMLNLSSTPLAGKQADVAKHVISALRGIYADLRDHRKGKQPSSAWAQEFEEFQKMGGKTGYRDMFQTSKQRAEAIEREIRKAGKGEAAWKVFSEDHPIGGWLSDYNTTLENAWRLAAYKVAKENNMSQQQAAALAKNLTVNFNKKGQAATQMGAMYAFFNAAVQGTARIKETMIKDGKLTAAGQKIMLGGITVGIMQAVMAALAGWDDEEPPQFLREKNFIIPMPDGKYISIPYPLGFHVIPNFGRISTEFVLGGFKDPAKRLVQMANMFIDGFNPLGSSTPLQTLTPTVVDPITALSENRDWSGKNIYKEDFNAMKPTPGWTRTKDTATDLSKYLAYGFNYISGGGKYGIGVFSPTPDQLDYIGGQLTGGLGREISKGWQTGKTLVSGEELPAYKRPVLGRFYGETTGQASEMSKFYNSLKRIGEHASALDEMKEARDFEARREYLQEHPDARLVSLADKAQRELGYLKRQKRDALEKGEAGRVKMLEARITATVQRWNERLSPNEK